MPFPRILLAVPLLAAGILLPAAGADPTPPPRGAIGMVHEYFTTDHVTVHRGDTVTLVNNSRWAHIIGPGRDGSLEEADGLPMHERVFTETNDRYTTQPWNEPGSYYLTCSMHPDMNVNVVVTP